MVKVVLIIVLLIVATQVQPVFGFSAGAGSGAGGGSRVANEELIPAIVELRGVGKGDIQIVYRKGKAFLPLLSVFQFLGIKADFANDHTSITGFYPKPEKKYSFDILSGRLKTADTSATLSIDEYMFSDDEVFLEERCYSAYFRIKAHYNDRRLAVTVTPSQELPVIAAKGRERARRLALTRKLTDQPSYFINRSPSLMEFGKINWYLSSYTGPSRAPRTLYDLRFGSKLLNGDAYLTVRDYLGKRVGENNVHGYLLYPFENNKFLRAIRFGDITPPTLTSRSVIGVEVTNRPAARRILFGKEDHYSQFPSGSEVEFFYNATMTDYFLTKSDSTYPFSIPLHYGAGDYEIRSYDRWGEQRRNLIRAVIPSSMLPENETQYSISGGKIRGYDKIAGNMNIAHGFTKVLSMGAGIDFFNRNFAGRVAYPYVHGVARFTSSLTGDLYVSPLSLSQVNLEYQTARQLDLIFTSTSYADDPILNPGAVLTSTSFRISTPFTISGEEMGVSVLALNTVGRFSNQRGILGNLAIHVSGMTLAYALEYSRMSTAGSFTANIFTSNPSISLRAPANMVFTGGFTYDHENKQFQVMNLSAEHALFKNLYLNFSFLKIFQPSASYLGLQLNYHFPFMSISSKSTRLLNGNTGFGTNYVNTAGGQIFISSRTGDVFLQHTRQANRGAFLIKPFVDGNGNGTHDDGEEYLPKTRMATQSVALHVNPIPGPRGTLLTNVEPYQPYNIFIDRHNTFENPQWVPMYHGISAVGEPNSLKIVEYPVVVGGNIRGSVLLKGNGTPIPIDGLNITLQPVGGEKSRIEMSRKTITFSDGTYEFLAVPPGLYEVFISPSDLQAIGLSAPVLSRPVTVTARPEGDQIEGVNFDVH